MSSLQRPDINPGHSGNPYYVSQDKRGPPLESVLRGPRIGPYFVAFDPKQEVIADMEFQYLYNRHNIFQPSALRHYLLSYGSKDDILMEPPTFAHLASNLVHYLIAANEAEMDPVRVTLARTRNFHFLNIQLFNGVELWTIIMDFSPSAPWCVPLVSLS
ncbi:hypothetical protein RhiJN_08676 [Ceratobasidium sp. AG-Ba]|nr:hypothetical protein RhiJN_08676 [Ceratobasidium sp. AG-Ba]